MDEFREKYGLSERHACRIVGQHRGTQRYVPTVLADEDELTQAIIARPAELQCARLWYEPQLERRHEDAIVRLLDLVQLEQIAGGYPSRERLLTELTLDPPDATSDQAGFPRLDNDYLILSTIHSTKGQEWNTVYVLNVVDGRMPSDLGAEWSIWLRRRNRRSRLSRGIPGPCR